MYILRSCLLKERERERHEVVNECRISKEEKEPPPHHVSHGRVCWKDYVSYLLL